MNAPTQRAETSALATQQMPNYEVGQVNNAASLILGPAFDRVQTFAKMMSSGSVSVPKHLRGNQGDCMAITIQALGWGMNPFAVAQKTHLSQSGALGYEAQLVSAILVSTGAVKAEPEYEPFGDWSKLLGKVEERQGKARDDGSAGGKYYVATYTKKDEEGVGVIVRATLSGESKPRELRVLMSQAYPRFSTQWATDPYQQLCYLAVRKFGRLNAPGAILGVNTPDELDGIAPTEKHMGPAEVVQPEKPATYPQDQFEKNLPAWRDVIAKNRKTADQIIAMAETKHPLTDEQKAAVRAKPPVEDAKVVVSYAQVADKLNAAGDMDKLAEAGSLIGEVADPQQRTELTAIYERRAAELNP